MIKLVELFGGLGAGRKSLMRLGFDVKSIDHVEIDPLAVRSYNAMFSQYMNCVTQDVLTWDLRPDALLHGSPCQDITIAGQQDGADEGSETRSSLMWETVHKVQDMGAWRPKNVVWENVKAVRYRRMRPNFERYLHELKRLGYSNSVETLDARDFGIPQARERVFVVSTLGNRPFDFRKMEKKPMEDIKKFLLPNEEVDRVYDVTQPSVYNAIGKKGIRRATVIEDYAYTITTRQDRTPAQVVSCGNDRFRYLTELECWRLQGYDDEDYYAAAAVTERKGRFRMPLYKQAGNSIPITFFESMFDVMF